MILRRGKICPLSEDGCTDGRCKVGGPCAQQIEATAHDHASRTAQKNRADEAQNRLNRIRADQERTAGAHIGFTGTQHGTTVEQREAVATLLDAMEGPHFHHGDCVGADAEIDEIARRAGYRIHIHPPENPRKRSFCEVRPDRDTAYDPAPYLTRNRRIAFISSLLIATPAEPIEQSRSGTWSTLRYARKIGRPVIIILPDGSSPPDH